MARATKIKFGDYLNVTDEGGGVIRVDGCAPGGTAAASYEDAILSHPCIAHYWPCDEASGDLIDRKGAWNMFPEAHAGYPLYGSTGPFNDFPALTSVENDGSAGLGPAQTQRFENFGIDATFWAGTNPFSVECWLKLAALGTSGGPEIISTNSAIIMYLWYPGGGGSGTPEHIAVARAGGVQVVDPEVLPLDQWHYVVVTYDGTTMRLYRNGTLRDSVASSGSVSSSGTNLAFLNHTFPSSYSPWRGNLAQVAIYNCALTEEEIDEHLIVVGAVSGTGSVINVIAAYTANPDDIVLASGTFTVTLPTAVGNSGEEIVVKNTGAGTITVAQDGTETIDGSATDLTLAATDSVVLVSNGTGWYITSSYSYP